MMKIFGRFMGSCSVQVHRATSSKAFTACTEQHNEATRIDLMDVSTTPRTYNE